MKIVGKSIKIKDFELSFFSEEKELKFESKKIENKYKKLKKCKTLPTVFYTKSEGNNIAVNCYETEIIYNDDAVIYWTLNEFIEAYQELTDVEFYEKFDNEFKKLKCILIIIN